MSKSKRIIFWVICYILSFLSLFIAFPILLFSFYPYSIIAVAVYVVAIVVLSVFSFLKNNNKHKILKKLLFGVMLLPVIALLTILVSIEAGWLHYPG
jgi:NADH:ubiquinone oxidoreductase subunit 6 (subunit J)